MSDLPQYTTPVDPFEAIKRPSRSNFVFRLVASCTSAKRLPAPVVVVKGWRRAIRIDRFLARIVQRSLSARFFACQKSHLPVARRNPLDEGRHSRLWPGGKASFPPNCRAVFPGLSYFGLGGLSPSYRLRCKRRNRLHLVLTQEDTLCQRHPVYHTASVGDRVQCAAALWNWRPLGARITGNAAAVQDVNRRARRS